MYYSIRRRLVQYINNCTGSGTKKIYYIFCCILIKCLLNKEITTIKTNMKKK